MSACFQIKEHEKDENTSKPVYTEVLNMQRCFELPPTCAPVFPLSGRTCVSADTEHASFSEHGTPGTPTTMTDNTHNPASAAVKFQLLVE